MTRPLKILASAPILLALGGSILATYTAPTPGRVSEAEDRPVCELASTPCPAADVTTVAVAGR
jgi:hypothetical protein